MPDFTIINNTYAVQSPMFAIGDMVQHTFTFSATESWTIVGKISVRIYNEESDGTAYWEYLIDGIISPDGSTRFNPWGEVIAENELTACSRSLVAA